VLVSPHPPPHLCEGYYITAFTYIYIYIYTHTHTHMLDVNIYTQHTKNVQCCNNQIKTNSVDTCSCSVEVETNVLCLLNFQLQLTWWMGKEKFLRSGTNSEVALKSHEIRCVSANIQAILAEICHGFSVCPGKWQDGAFSLPQSAPFISFDSCIGFTGSCKLSEATVTVDCITPLYITALCQ